MLIEIFKERFFNLYINDMAAFDGTKSLCLQKCLLCTLLRSRVVQTRHYPSGIGVVLVSLLLTLDIFHTLL